MGIPILTPEAVKSSKQAEFDSVQRRSIGLAEEENRIVTSLNLTREAADERSGEIALEIQTLEQQAEERKRAIKDEIAGLEKQRDLIMAPIENRQKAVEEREKGVLDRENAITTREGKVQAREEDAASREASVSKAEEMLSSREASLAPKEEEQARREEAIRSGHSALTDARNAFDEEKRAALEDIATKRAKNDADESANTTERERLAQREAHYQSKDREIADRYATLTESAEYIRAAKRALEAKGVDTSEINI